MSSLSLRSYNGKKLVSYLRKGDYAHAGETESIIQVMNRFEKNKTQRILDVGCGLGGTANFIAKNGWGKVTGIDIELDSINYANKYYSNVEFICFNALDADQILKVKFDIICLFNSFYAINDQLSCLQSLAKVASSSSTIAIFDYSYLGKDSDISLIREENIEKNILAFKPINIELIPAMLRSASWKLVEIVDISYDYIRWYYELINKLLMNKINIIQKYGEDSFNRAYITYTNIYEALRIKSLGGAIVYACKF